MITTDIINVDLAKPGAMHVVNAVQNDKYSRNVVANLYLNGSKFLIPDGATVVASYNKPDGTGGIYDSMPDGSIAWNIDGNSVTVALAPQVLAAAGMVNFSITLIQGKFEISVFSISIHVHPLPSFTAQSEDYVNMRDWLSAELNKALEEAKASGEFKGDPFVYEDFTEEQLAALQGEPGITPQITLTNSKELDGRGNVTIEVSYTDENGIVCRQSGTVTDGKDGENCRIESTHTILGEPVNDVYPIIGTKLNFSDGTVVSVMNGKDGKPPVKGVDYFTAADKEEFTAGLAQVEPPVIVSAMDEMTDPAKHYVLGGYIYSMRTVVVPGETTSPNLFTPSADFLNKRMSGSNGSVSAKDGSFITDFIAVPDGFASITPFTVRLNRESLCDGNAKAVFFNSSKNRVGANILRADTNTTISNGETVSDIKVQGDSSSVLPTDWSAVAYVRMEYRLSTSVIAMTDIENCVVTFDANEVTTEPTTKTEFVNSGITYPQMFDSEAITKNTTDIAALKADVKELKQSGTSSGVSSGAVWYAVGDSITSGYLIGGPTKTWVAHVMKYNGYDAAKSRNLGVAGIGFVREDPTNAQVVQDIVNSNDFSNVDLVTVAVGINDWQNNCAIEDVKTAMVACFDKILSDNPYCKIFFITPFNKNRGSKETNWALGYEQNGITLEDFVAGQISACNDYGIEVIDMTHNSVINRENLTSVLYDNTHPNETCHIALGRELARKITFA